MGGDLGRNSKKAKTPEKVHSPAASLSKNFGGGGGGVGGTRGGGGSDGARKFKPLAYEASRVRLSIDDFSISRR